MAKGDFIEVAYITGGLARTEVKTQGRSIEGEFTKEGGLQWYTITEKTRAGTVTQQVHVSVGQIAAITQQIKEV